MKKKSNKYSLLQIYEKLAKMALLMFLTSPLKLEQIEHVYLDKENTTAEKRCIKINEMTMNLAQKTHSEIIY